MITGRVIGAEAVVQKFAFRAPDEVRARVAFAIRGLGYLLQRNVQSNQLNGGVLGRRSGRLARSINAKFIESADVFTSRVGSNVFYGRIWELTGFSAHDIVPKTAQALFWKGAMHPVKVVHVPAQSARPWLRPALEEMRPVIHDTLLNAMRGL